VHLDRIGFNADVVQTGVGEGGREIAGATTDVEQGRPAGVVPLASRQRSVTIEAVSSANAP